MFHGLPVAYGMSGITRLKALRLLLIHMESEPTPIHDNPHTLTAPY